MNNQPIRSERRSYLGGTRTSSRQEPIRGKKVLMIFIGMFLLMGFLGGVSAEKVWNFNNYTVNISDDLYVGGILYGNGSGLTDLDVSSLDLSAYVPYTGATSNLVLGDYNFSVGTSDFFVDSSTGRVGIGTGSPESELSVNGRILSTSIGTAPTTGTNLEIYYSATGTIGKIYVYDRDASVYKNISFPGGNVGIGTTTPQNTLNVIGTVNATSFVGDGSSLTGISAGHWNVSGSNFYPEDLSYNVGIGTSNPSVRLHIADRNKIRIGGDDTSGEYLQFENFDGGARITSSEGTSDAEAGYGRLEFLNNGNKTTGLDKGGFIFKHADGTEFMRIRNDGNVGIGTGSPANTLHLNKTGNNNLRISSTQDAGVIYESSDVDKFLIGYDDSPNGFRIYDYQGTAGTRFFVESSSGNVGIGTTNPGYSLEVKSGGSSTYALAIQRSSDTNLLGGIFEPIDGSAEFYLKNSSDSSKIKLDTNGDSYFNGGNVGIGIGNPSSRLHVLDDGTNADIGHFEMTDGTKSATIKLVNDAGNYGGFTYGRSGASTNPNKLQLVNNGTTAMTIDTNGNVGIGTTTPQNKLNVIGDGNFTGDLYSNGVLLGGSGELNSSGWNRSGTDVFLANSGDNVGIGSISGGAKLEISSTVDGDQLLRLKTDRPWGFYQQGEDAATSLAFRPESNGKTFIIQSPDATNVAYFYPQDVDADSRVVLVQDGGRVGIGTSIPNDKLEVLDGDIRIRRQAADTDPRLIIQNDAKVWSLYTKGTDSDKFQIRDSSLGLDRLTIDSTGNVGIGTTNPSAKLEVVDNLYLGTHSGVVNPTHGLLIENATGYAQIQLYKTGGSTFEIKTDGSELLFDGSSGSDREINLINSGAGNIKVGIGTTTPDKNLDVVGILGVSSYTYNGGNVETYENVAEYYAGNTNTGTLVIKIASPPNFMIDAEISTQGYGKLAKYHVRGYTYTSTTAWHDPEATMIGSDQNPTIRVASDASNNRYILLGSTSFSWGSYLHAAVDKVSVGYGSGIGTWSMYLTTDESAFTSIQTVIPNKGFVATKPVFSGRATVKGEGNDGTYTHFLVEDQWGNDDFKIDGAGYVGIGTATPKNKLNVIGDINATGTIYGDIVGTISGTADNSLACNADGTCETTKITVAGDGGTIGGATMANGWIRVGNNLAMDDNEFYFANTPGYIGTIGNQNLNIQSGAELNLRMDWNNDGTNAINFLNGTGANIGNIDESGNLQMDGDLTVNGGDIYGGGAGESGIWRFSPSYPNYGIFYTETTNDVISFSPNGGGTATPVLKIVGDGTSIFSGDLTVSGGDIYAYGNEVYFNTGGTYLSGDTTGYLRTNGNFNATGDICLSDGTCLSNTGTGSGDVAGPASSTDNAIARFDSTTGKIIQNSGVTIDDNGNIATSRGSGINTTMTLYGADDTKGNRIIVGADDTSAYIQSTYGTGGSSNLRFFNAGTETMVLSGGNLQMDGDLTVSGGNINLDDSANVQNSKIDWYGFNGYTGSVSYTDNDRWEWTGGSFYLTDGVPITYIYSGTIYLGSASGDNVRLRDNELYGDDWMINYNQAGNWGIGDTTPDAKLDVEGHIRIGSGNDLIFSNAETASEDWSLGAEGENFFIREKEQSDKFYFGIYDDSRIAMGAGRETFSVNGGLFLGNFSGNYVELTNVQTTGRDGGGSNIYHKEWRLRDVDGVDWTTQRIHDGISVDASYGTPGTDTRVWWERDPYNQIQEWGSGATTHMTLDSTGVTATAFFYSSDEALKTNITLINNSLDKILQLKGVNFNWKDSGDFTMGLVAQEVEKVFPEIVGENEDGMKSVQYGNLVAPIIEAIKELDKKDKNQDNEIEELKREIELLRAEIAALS